MSNGEETHVSEERKTPGQVLHEALSRHGANRYNAEWGDLSDDERADLEAAAPDVLASLLRALEAV